MTISQLLPNAGYEECADAFVNLYTWDFTVSIPVYITALSNCVLSSAAAPGSIPGGYGGTNSLRVAITNTASPAIFAIFGTGTSGQAVHPCSRYRIDINDIFGPSGGGEGSTTRVTFYVDQYDSTGTVLSGGAGLETSPTGSADAYYDDAFIHFDTEPNAAYIRIRISITGRSANHDVYILGGLLVPHACYSRFWKQGVVDATATTDLLTDYTADALSNEPIPAPTVSPTFEGCTGLPYEGSKAAQAGFTFGTDGTGYGYLAFGPIDVEAGQDYTSSYVFAAAFDAVNARIGMLWFNASWTGIRVDLNSQDGLDNNDGCWFPVTANFTAPANAVHAVMLAAVANPGNNVAAWAYDATSVMGVAVVTPTGSQTPARTSDVPFLNANDRYQVVACVDAGTSTTTAEFRYWFSGAPEWDLSLNSDTQYPPFHTLDENSTYPPASVETPFKSIKTGQEDQIQGVYVEFVARPTALTEATVTSTYSVGFTARVEGISVPDWNRTVGTTVLTSGVVVSTNQVYETTAEVHDSSAWPNLRSAFLPCRLTGKVRAARVILTDVHLVAIRRIQLVGKLTPGRDA